MSDDDEIQQVAEMERAADGKPSHFEMDEAFCARMRMAIAAGLETAPIGVVTAPGTGKPKYFPAERLALASQRDVDH
jgi:3-oxoacyl-(acyl-carrier-protein) synthase